MREYAYLCSKTKKNMEILRIPFKPITLEDADVFSLEKIFENYEEDFCNACGTRLLYFLPTLRGRSSYDMFLMYRETIQWVEDSKWDDYMHLRIRSQDLERFRDAVKLLMGFKTYDGAVLPMLLVLSKLQQSISKVLREESDMLDYVYPRKSECNYRLYEEFIVDHPTVVPEDYTPIEEITEYDLSIIEMLKKERKWDKDWQDILNKVSVENNHLVMIGYMCGLLANRIYDSYNDSLRKFSNNLSGKVYRRDSNVKHAIVYRIFLAHLLSYGVVKNMFQEYPDYILKSKLLEIRASLIKEFKQYALGSLWCDSIRLERGLEYVGHYFVNHRDEMSEEEEEHFFGLLDEINLITDVLTGKAAKIYFGAKYVYDPEEDNPQAEAKSEAPSLFYSVVIIHAKAQEVIAMIPRFMEGKTKPKDVIMPIRAAMDAGVIGRPTWEEYQSEFGDGRVKSKSSLNDYTNPQNNKYYGEAYNKMMEMFQQLIKE